jgi:hypothetical protein
MRSLRSDHAPHAGSQQHQRRFTPTNRTTAPNPGKSGLTRRAALSATVQVGRLARPVAQVAAELSVAWHTVMDSVPDAA